VHLHQMKDVSLVDLPMEACLILEAMEVTAALRYQRLVWYRLRSFYCREALSRCSEPVSKK
jgi:hypothetical protein